ncbi:LacI family transcriptional regulator [Sorangium cellulosum]|uniref:LacI family transcriptional regulator n=1 Tax=Sorangium cellulosum TaxID=56 RepID=A0A150TM91_SORCE|nr:LacI family transcriptional regulator [Sorangium cellulosum]
MSTDDADAGTATMRKPSARAPPMPSRPTTIGVLTPFLDGFYFSAILKGVHQAAQQRGHRVVVICGTPDFIQAPSLARDQVDGWIVVLATDGIERLAAARVPLVTISTCAPEAGCPTVMPDNRKGMRAAVRHLVEHGHRRIAYVGFMDQDDIRERFESYKETLAESGIPFDPGLVFEAENNWQSGGAKAAEAILARRGEFTAAVVATDKNALGMMSVLQAAGCRIPDDLAIVGFDDITEAQWSTPPLTTVRQRFDGLGKIACELVLAQLAGEAVPPGPVLAPTSFVPRRTCGCNMLQGFLHRRGGAPDEVAGGVLARQMVELLIGHPLPSDTPPAAVWPGVATVIEGHLAALEGTSPPPSDAIDEACQQAVRLTPDVESLMGIARLLGRHRRPRAGWTAEAAESAEARVEEFLERLRLSLTLARIDAERQFVEELGVVVRSDHEVSLALLGGTQEESRSLSWLDSTTAVWGCLGLWEDPMIRERLVVTGAYSREGTPTPALGGVYAREAFPPAELLPPSTAGGPFMVTLQPIRTLHRDWGVLAIVGPGSIESAGDEGTVAIWGALLSAALERDALMQSLSEQHASLEEAYLRERALSAAVRELGCPLIPLLRGVLLVPLIGELDTGRAREVLERVVEGVNQHRARCVLLDVTGVPRLDAPAAHALEQIHRAAALLGARVILVGVRPEIAMSLVALDIDLGDLSTHQSLSSALEDLAPEGLGALRTRRNGEAPRRAAAPEPRRRRRSE